MENFAFDDKSLQFELPNHIDEFGGLMDALQNERTIPGSANTEALPARAKGIFRGIASLPQNRKGIMINRMLQEQAEPGSADISDMQPEEQELFEQAFEKRNQHFDIDTAARRRKHHHKKGTGGTTSLVGSTFEEAFDANVVHFGSERPVIKMNFENAFDSKVVHFGGDEVVKKMSTGKTNTALAATIGMEYGFEKNKLDLEKYDLVSIPGLPTSLPSDPRITFTPAFHGNGIYKATDNVLSYPRTFFHIVTPMGVWQDNGTPQSDETPATDVAAGNFLFNQIFNAINPWLDANGFKGSGNVSTAQARNGMVGNWKSDADPFAAIQKYINFLNEITDPNFHTANAPTGLAKIVKTVGKDITKVADAVAKVVVTIAKDAVKILKTAGEDIAFAPLLIFKKPMKDYLNSHGGYGGDNTILDVTGHFLKALMSDKSATQKFDFEYAYHIDGPFDEYGLPVAPAYISAPVSLACKAIGIGEAPGLPPPADVLWHFLHKECANPDSPCAQQLQAGAAAYDIDHKDDHKKDKEVEAGVKLNVFGKKLDVQAFFQSPKKVIGIIVVIVGIVVVTGFLLKKEHKKAA